MSQFVNRNQGRGGGRNEGGRGGNFNNGGRGPSNRQAVNPFANNQPALVQQPRPPYSQPHQQQQSFGSAKQPFTQGQNRQYQPRPQGGRGANNPFSGEPVPSSGTNRIDNQKSSYGGGFNNNNNNNQGRGPKNAGSNPFASSQQSAGQFAATPVQAGGFGQSPFAQQQQQPHPPQQHHMQNQNAGFGGFGSSSSSSTFGGNQTGAGNPFAANNNNPQPQSTAFGMTNNKNNNSGNPFSSAVSSSTSNPFNQSTTTMSSNPFGGGGGSGGIGMSTGFGQQSYPVGVALMGTIEDNSMIATEINIKNVLGDNGGGMGGEEEAKQYQQAEQQRQVEEERKEAEQLAVETAASTEKLAGQDAETRKLVQECIAYMEAYPLKDYLKKMSDNPWDHRNSNNNNKKLIPGLIPEKMPATQCTDLFANVENIFQ